MFRLSRPKLGMFRLCSTYVLTFQTEIRHVLDLCFAFPDRNWACARLMFRLSRPKLGMFRLCFDLPVLHLCFDFPDRNLACARLSRGFAFPDRNWARLMFLTYVSTFPTKIGHVSIVLHLCFDFPDRNLACARLIAFPDRNWAFLDLCLDFPTKI